MFTPLFIFRQAFKTHPFDGLFIHFKTHGEPVRWNTGTILGKKSLLPGFYRWSWISMRISLQPINFNQFQKTHRQRRAWKNPVRFNRYAPWKNRRRWNVRCYHGTRKIITFPTDAKQYRNIHHHLLMIAWKEKIGLTRTYKKEVKQLKRHTCFATHPKNRMRATRLGA